MLLENSASSARIRVFDANTVPCGTSTAGDAYHMFISSGCSFLALKTEYLSEDDAKIGDNGVSVRQESTYLRSNERKSIRFAWDIPLRFVLMPFLFSRSPGTG